MGIKGIHLTLIVASIFLALVLALWLFQNSLPVFALASIAMALVLGVYGVNFLKKARSI